MCGQKFFGRLVLGQLLRLPGVEVVAVVAPAGRDRLREYAAAAEIPAMMCGTLHRDTLPADTDLIVCAHSHDFVGQETRFLAQYGAIGYHPSLLPLYRGRSAVEWAIKLRERVTGGTVYRLNNTVDAGSILEQRPVFVRPGATVRELWREQLQPLGVELLCNAVKAHVSGGYTHGTDQEEACATWFPSMERAPLPRPDLMLIAHPDHPGRTGTGAA